VQVVPTAVVRLAFDCTLDAFHHQVGLHSCNNATIERAGVLNACRLCARLHAPRRLGIAATAACMRCGSKTLAGCRLSPCSRDIF